MSTEIYTNACVKGNNILVRGVDKHGVEFATKQPYAPTLYKHGKGSGYTDIFGKELKAKTFDTIKEAREYIQQYKDIPNVDLFGQSNYAYSYLLESYPNAEAEWDRAKIRTFALDIEVQSDQGFPQPDEAKFPVTAITIHDSKTDKFVTFGLDGDWTYQDSSLDESITNKVYYIRCANELDLFRRFLHFWTGNYPNVVTGWNTDGFDIPYIYNRMEKLGFDTKKLSPWNSVRTRPFTAASGKIVNYYYIEGIDLLDYLDIYKRRAFKVQESYRLDHIAHVELGQRKLDYSEAGNLFTLYLDDFQKFIDYNIQDVNLIVELDKKLGLLDVTFAIAYKAGVNFSDVQGSVKTWDSLIYRELLSRGNQPNMTFGIKNADNIVGGYVKDPQVGKHGWVISFDLASLYPHLIMQYNISPEMLVEDSWVDMEVDCFLDRKPHGAPAGQCVTATGWGFKTDKQGFMPKLMSDLYNERKEYKKKMIQAQKAGKSEFEVRKMDLAQMVRKILLNSGYGAFANKYFRYFDPRIAESITKSGQLSIRNSERCINKWMNKILKTEDIDYIIAIDTDSNYVNMQPLVDKFFADKSRSELVDILDKIASEQIEKIIREGYDELADYMQARENKMEMEREAIANAAVWTAKKRYCMNVWDNEGVRYEEAKVKIQGLEAVKSSTPGPCKPKLKEAINLILTSDETTVQKYIAEFKEEFKSLDPVDIAFPRTINNIQKFHDSGTVWGKGSPAHIRGALLYNKLLKDHNIDKKYEVFQSGEKGKFIYLKKPNPSGSDVISFSNILPKEFGVHSYIDINKQFDKAFISPIKIILDAIGWETERRITLMSLFD